MSETTEIEEFETSESDELEADLLGEEELPARPRGRWRRPLPIALAALLIASLGFLAGVLVQKGAGGEGGSAGTPGGGGLPSFAAAAGAQEGGGEASGGEGGSAAGEGAAAMPSFGTEAAATGTVASVDGNTIYVKESDGTVVAVKAEDGATVTRDAEVGAAAVRPGDTVVVEGSKKGSKVKASSIAATEDGVESGLGGFGAPAISGSGAGEGSGEGEAGASVGSLFE